MNTGQSKRVHGFLECDFRSEALTFKFIPVGESVSVSKGGRKRNSVYKRTKLKGKRTKRIKRIKSRRSRSRVSRSRRVRKTTFSKKITPKHLNTTFSEKVGPKHLNIKF